MIELYSVHCSGVELQIVVSIAYYIEHNLILVMYTYVDESVIKIGHQQ